jgi:uncharacterized SAM-binding protein YcdF (DUF218 family)
MYALLAALTRPYTLLLVICGGSLACLWYRRREVRRCLVLAFVPWSALYLVSTPLVVRQMARSLTGRYDRLERRPLDAPAIVVLSGAVHRPDDRRAELGASSITRCVAAAEIYLSTEPCPVLVTGGSGDPWITGPPAAVLMASFLKTLGVREGHLIVEGNATSTFENAVESARLLKARGIRRAVVVTDATHLRRAEGCFRRQGIDVVSAASQSRITLSPLRATDFLPSATAAWRSETVFHEWLGLLWYWVNGRI